MAHMMNQQMTGSEMDRQMMNGMNRLPDQIPGGGLSPMEPRQDETGYSIPADRTGMTPYDMQQSREIRGGQPGWNPGMPIPGMGGTTYPGGPSSAFEQSQRMKNPVDMETTHTPTNSSDAYQASLRSLLARNVGFFIVATFLTGTQRMVTWQGILHTVGSDYIVIYQPDYERYISCDFYAIKFVQFHNTRSTPYCASSHTWMAQDT